MDIRPITAATTAATQSAQPSAESRLTAILAGSREYVDVTVPRTDPPIHGKLRRLTRAEEEDVSIALGRWLRAMSDAGAPPPTRLELNSQEATRTIAIAVRDPSDPSKPLGSLEEWCQGDDGQIGAVYQAYLDLVERTELFRAELDVGERFEIADAVKKKDAMRLLSYGARRLATYLITSVAEPASSPTTT